jgi:hypothetical protein
MYSRSRGIYVKYNKQKWIGYAGAGVGGRQPRVGTQRERGCNCLVKTILQEELGLQEKAGAEWRPGFQVRVKKWEEREKSDLRKIGKRR